MSILNLMQEKLIRLCYHKFIDVHATTRWEKYVFEDTYTEFLLQAQYYNQEKKYTSFSELIRNTPAAEKLHFLVSTAAIGYVKQLNGKVPDILNSLGKLFLPFENFRFEIVNSDIKDKTAHQVAINFYTNLLTWHDTINNQLFISIPDHIENDEILTELFSMPSFMSIYSIKQMPVVW